PADARLLRQVPRLPPRDRARQPVAGARRHRRQPGGRRLLPAGRLRALHEARGGGAGPAAHRWLGSPRRARGGGRLAAARRLAERHPRLAGARDRRTVREASPLTLNRLSLYLRCLQELRARGVERVSSTELADHYQLSASQIRKDLAQFGEFGIRGVGYEVP